MQTDDGLRRWLDVGWSLLPSSAAAFASPEALPEAGWFALPTLTTVAGWAQVSGRPLTEWAPRVDADALDWWYRLRFDSVDALASEAVLGFDGLATLSQAWLNGELLLSSDSMFTTHRCAVGDRLRAEGNELVMCFRSLSTALAKRRPRPAWRVPMLEQQQLRWFRTTLLGRTPGWTPPTPPIGPWRDIWLAPQHAPSVDDVELRVRVDAGVGVVDLSCRIVIPTPSLRAVLVLQRGEQRVDADLSRGADGRWHGRVRVPDAVLWWPHTHGEPLRYLARIEWHDAGVSRHELGSVGFRTLEADTNDGGFRLIVNGEPIFCRGACWMPPDPIGWRPAEGEVLRMVERVRDAGMNMLRVSGTMAYESDEFFEACDALGVLVWQDLMFANMDYPAADAAFIEGVRSEVTTQLRRWQGRPSLAVVCGNSEVAQQAAMWGAPREAWSPPLFHATLPALVGEFLPDTPYWPSSASGGAFPHQPDHGTSSYYGVGAYLRPLSDARRSEVRFATECLAFANVPTAQAIARMPGGAGLRVTHAGWKARAPRDLTAGWDFEDVRDHYMAALFGVDPMRLRYEDHERYLALARATSGEVMTAAFSEWRRAGSACAGALIWFLRDLWAGAGWGVLDDSGEPKACFHALRRVLQSRAVVLTDEGSNGLVAHLINERPEPLATQLNVEAWRGETRVYQGQAHFDLAPRAVRAVPLIDLLGHFGDLNHAYRFGPLAHDVVVVSLIDGNGTRLAQAHHFPAGLALPRQNDLGIDASSRSREDGQIELTLSTRCFALGVHFEAPGYQADDEFFHLSPGQAHSVLFRPDGVARPWWGRVLALNASSATAIRHTS